MSKQPNPPPEAYPRCATCKHYNREIRNTRSIEHLVTLGRFSEYGRCGETKRFILEAIGDVEMWPGALFVSPDFGCVLHSEITPISSPAPSAPR